MRVLFVEPTRGLGGSARCLVRFAPRLATHGVQAAVLAYQANDAIHQLGQRGVEVFDLALPDPVPPDPFVKCAGVPIPTLGFVRVCNGVAQAIRRYRPDVLYLNTLLYSMIPALLMGKLFRIPTVCHLRETLEPLRAERLAMPYVRLFVTLTDAGQQFFVAQGIPADRIRRVYDAVDPALFDGRRAPREADTFTLGIVGALIPRKGHHLLFQALQARTPSEARVRLLIAGEGPERAALETQCAKLGIQDRVEFLGYIKDIGSLLGRLDALVFPSLQEGFPQVGLEAMVASLPVIASALPGLDEMIENGRSGLLVPPGDVEALRSAIQRLAGDRLLADQMGRRGRERVDTGAFSPDREAQDIAAVVREAATGRLQVP